MKKLYLILCALLISSNCIYAFTWDTCLEKYDKARQFSDNTELLYIYLKSTRNCVVKFKSFLIQNPDPEYSVKVMNENIVMLDKNINLLIPNYEFPKNELEEIPKYLNINSQNPIINKDYKYIKKFENCNGIHAENKIYTAKHCRIDKSRNMHFDLNYIEVEKNSNLTVSKLDLKKKDTFKYYSMSKVGMFYNSLLQEKNCEFYEAQNIPTGLNTTLDLTDLTKKIEIRSNCLAIPSNSGGGVFQDGKLVAIISKTVFNKNKFSYSIVEPIIPLYNEEELASLD